MELTSVQFATVVILLICAIQPGTIEARANKKGPIILDEDSWTQLLKGEWMFDLHAPWCPACKKLEPEWRRFSEWSDDLNINIASADITTNPGLSGRFLINGLPTIYHVKDGIFRVYSGPREHTALINFVEEQGWKNVEPISRWRAPDTLQMSFVAYAFRISMTLRDVHNYLVEDVGIPYYLSYSIFALSTVTLGTVLGLLIVFVCDKFCPTRYNYPDEAPIAANRRKKNDKQGDSDLDETNPTDSSKPSSSENIRRRQAKNK